tara:strand:- start:3109 stop:3405 length:297 start_codon:yes stop_codon:yes gene_type:complete
MASKSTKQDISFGDVDGFSCAAPYRGKGPGFQLHASIDDSDDGHGFPVYLDATAIITGPDASAFVDAIQAHGTEIYRLRREIDRLKSVANQARALLGD